MKDNAKVLDRIKEKKFILFIKCLEVVERVTFSVEAERKLRTKLQSFHNDQKKGKEKCEGKEKARMLFSFLTDGFERPLNLCFSARPD